jgi:hypothetical protein
LLRAPSVWPPNAGGIKSSGYPEVCLDFFASRTIDFYIVYLIEALTLESRIILGRPSYCPYLQVIADNMIVHNQSSPIKRKAVVSNSWKADQTTIVARKPTADLIHGRGLGMINVDTGPGGSLNTSDTPCSALHRSSNDDGFPFTSSKMSTTANTVDSYSAFSEMTTPLSTTDSFSGTWTSTAATTPLTPASVLFGGQQRNEIGKIEETVKFDSPLDTREVSESSLVAEYFADDTASPSSLTLKDRLKSTTDAAFWKHALAETKHFASGLLSQTTESTKHYTILRHSSPIILYRGASTSVTISIFSSPSHPIPADRTLWLQRRGFSGDTGLKIRAIVGADGAWTNVTPLQRFEAEKLDEADERAWQRDLEHVSQKEGKKGGKGHVVRETHVVRIPAALGDGYFRLALCTGGGGVPVEEEDENAKVMAKSHGDANTSMETEKVKEKNETAELWTKNSLMSASYELEQAPDPVSDGVDDNTTGMRKSKLQKFKDRTHAVSAQRRGSQAIKDEAGTKETVKSTFKKFRSKAEDKDTDKSEKTPSNETFALGQDGHKQKPKSTTADGGSGHNTIMLAKTSKYLLHRIKGKSEDKKEERRRVLCASPIFRMASASSDPSVFRGAALTSMPLELTVMAASLVAKAHVQTFVTPITSITSSLQPGFVTETVVRTAYDMSGLEEKVSARVDAELDALSVEKENLTALEANNGPKAPFPIKFSGTVVKGMGRATCETGAPTANLRGVPDHIKVHIKGFYFGWACIKPPKADNVDGKVPFLDWHAALIYIGPDPYAGPSVAVEHVVRLHILHDFGDAQPFFDSKVKVITMGYLRAIPSSPIDLERTKNQLADDIETVKAILVREGWGAEITLETLAATKSARSLGEKYADARVLVRNRTNCIPLHQLGIRSNSNAELIDKLYGTGGFWVAR